MEISGLSIGGKKMKYKKFENTIIARIDKGEDIVEQVKNIIALSGYINKDILPEDIKTRDYSNLDFYCSHGSVDQVIPVDWARQTAPFLNNLHIHFLHFHPVLSADMKYHSHSQEHLSHHPHGKNYQKSPVYFHKKHPLPYKNAMDHHIPEMAD